MFRAIPRRLIQEFARNLALVTMSIAILVAIGWQFDIEYFKSVVPDLASMKFNTAVGLLCLAFAVLFNSKSKTTSHILVFVAAAIGILTAFEYATGADLGIDELIFVDIEGRGELNPPGRPAPITALGIILLSAAHLFVSMRRPKYRIAQFLYLASLLICFQALVAYCLGVDNLFGLAAHTRIAVHTAFGLAMLSIAGLVLTTPHGYMRALMARGGTGATTRKLILFAIIVPPVFDLATQWAQRLGWIDADFGSLIKVMGSVAFFVALVWRSGEKLHISERKGRRTARRIENVERAKTRALDSAKFKSDFLANISHEIRTPLNGIIGMSQLFARTQLDFKQREYLGTIDVSSKALLTLINQILDSSKIESGNFSLESTHFELGALLQGTTKIVSFAAEEKGLELEIQIGPDVPKYLLGDSLRLQQVLLNLLNNAVKFTHLGKIELRVECVKSNHAAVMLRFEVVDQGIGMDEATRRKLFNAFEQGSGSTARLYGGTGLGLSISRQLVELMGGHIGVESVKGLGSRFHFEILLEISKFTNVREYDRATEAPQASGRVLVVEDIATNQRIAVEMLNLLGFESNVARNGIEALEKLKEEKFDVVLMDSQMPEMDGYEASRRVRKGEGGAQHTRVPIVAITANAIAGEMENCLACGMNDFIAKPIAFDEFARKVSKWISRGDTVISPETVVSLKSLAVKKKHDLLAELIDLFSKEMPVLLRDLRDAVARGDYAAVAKTAHAIKSSSGSLGAIRVRELSEILERPNANPVAEQTMSIIDTLHREYDLAVDELTKLKTA